MPITLHKPLVMIGGVIHRLPDGDRIFGGSDMDSEVYDPTGIGQDCFDRQFHHGFQLLETLSDAGNCAGLNVGTEAGTIAAGDHTHLCCQGDMRSELYDPQGVEEDIYDREFHHGTQKLDTISDAGGSAYLDLGPPEGGLEDTVAPGIHSHGSDYMLITTYDPDDIGSNVYDRDNHTGFQDADTITGLGDSALLDVGPAEGGVQNTVAPGIHYHNDIYMAIAVYDPQTIGENVFDRSFHTGFQILDTISDADMEGASDSVDGKRGVVPAPIAGEDHFYLRGDGVWADITETPGIMFTSVYDIDGDGVVDDAAKFDGVDPQWYLNRENHIGTQHYTTITELDTVFVSKDDVGKPGGIPTLDPITGKIPLDQLPEELISGIKFVDVWDASTNTPTLPIAAPENKGNYYRVNVEGETSIGGITDWKVGDWVISEGTAWSKVDNTDLVNSVFGRIGDVTADTTDLDDVIGTPTEGQFLVFRTDVWTPEDVVFGGDMLKEDYDSNDDGIVDDSDKLGSELPAYYLDRANHTGTQPIETITGLEENFVTKEDFEASTPALTPEGKIDPEQLPESLLEGLVFKGGWSASASVEAASDDNKGWYYRVTADGTQTVDGVSDWVEGDWIVSEGSKWTKAANSNLVRSVNELTGDVLLKLGDLDDVTAEAPEVGDVLVYDGGWTSASSGGDMIKADYDTDDSGVVDDSEKLGAEVPSFYLDLANATGLLASDQVTGLREGAFANFGTGADDMVRGDHTHDGAGDMKGSNNLSELTDPAAARALLGISEAAAAATPGTGPDDFAAGDHSHEIGDLDDVDLTGAQQWQTLKFDGTDTWTPTSLPAMNLEDLEDVNINMNGSYTSRQALVYDEASSMWINDDVIPVSLNDLESVDLTTPPVADQVLKFDGSNWVAGDFEEPDTGGEEFPAIYKNKIRDLLGVFKAKNTYYPITVYQDIGFRLTGLNSSLSSAGTENADGSMTYSAGQYVSCKAPIVNNNALRYSAALHISTSSAPTFGPTGILIEFSRNSGSTWVEADESAIEVDYANDNYVIWSEVLNVTVPQANNKLTWRMTNNTSSSITLYRFGHAAGGDNHSYTNQEEVRSKVLHLTGHSERVTDHGSVSGALELDLNDGNLHAFTPTAATTITLVNTIAGRLCPFTCMITDGFELITWPPGMIWVSGGGEEIDLKATGIDIVNLMTMDESATVIGTYVQ